MSPRYIIRIVIVCISGTLGCSSGRHHAWQPESAAQDLAVSRVVLYQNGVGYFERRGWVHDGRLVLRAQPNQVADLLKSLTIVSLSGGRAVSAALPAEPSRGHQMAQLPEQLRNGGGLLAMASVFRGAHVVVHSRNETCEGRLLGVENIQANDAAGEGWRLSVFTESGAIRVVKLSEVVELKVLDRTLELGLHKSLDVALGEASWKPVDLVVRLDGERDQEWVVSYLVEMPKWRPAYRLVLGDAADAEGIFQGWAVIDNLSGEDWQDVRLSLVSGTPLAFRYNLYTPRFGVRPDLTPPEMQATAAIPQAMDVEAPMFDAPSAMAAPMPSAAPAPSYSRQPARRQRKEQAERFDTAPSPEALQRSFGSMVKGAAVGAVFRYDIEAPVSVRDQQSALVLLANKQVQSQDVWLFRVGQDDVHPYRAARLTVPPDVVLETGPVAMYRRGTFLGEALAGHVEAGATTFLPYAVDGRVRVDLEERNTEEEQRLVKIVRGTLTSEAKNVAHYKYTVSNGTDEATTLWISRPVRSDYKPTGPGADKLVQQSGTLYFPLAVTANGKTTVELREESPTTHYADVVSGEARDLLAATLRRQDLSPQLAALLTEVQKLVARLAAIQEESRSAQEQKHVYSQRQAEVRANLTTLGKTSASSDLRGTLERSLGDLEKQLDALSRKIVSLSIEAQEVRDTLAKKLDSVSLDG